MIPKYINRKYENKPGVFLHIPKTGGVTLREIIDHQYRADEVEHIGFYCFEDHPLLKSEFDRALKNKKLKFAHGHFSFLVNRYISRPVTFITMLREPVDRVVSLYYFLLQGGAIQAGIDEFLESTDGGFLTSNFQTLLICGNQTPCVDTAKNNLTNYFSVVGITEMFNESIYLMKREFGWGDISYERLNITVGRPQLKEMPADIIKKIQQKNKLDLELYNWAKENLEKKIQS